MLKEMSLSARRAWIEIFGVVSLNYKEVLSLSARRAWIEILASRLTDMSDAVALRKESVDRNLSIGQPVINHIASLSARRAWIEIYKRTSNGHCLDVALRKESVDRNNIRHPATTLPSIVALRKESVDRNADPVLNA